MERGGYKVAKKDKKTFLPFSKVGDIGHCLSVGHDLNLSSDCIEELLNVENDHSKVVSLGDLNKQMQRLITKFVPSVSFHRMNTLRNSKFIPCEAMGITCGLSNAMVLSCNYASSASYARKDVGMRVVVCGGPDHRKTTREEQSLSENISWNSSQYLVFPKMEINVHGKRYQGVFVRLFLGLLLCFDAKVLYHTLGVPSGEFTSKNEAKDRMNMATWYYSSITINKLRRMQLDESKQNKVCLTCMEVIDDDDDYLFVHDFHSMCTSNYNLGFHFKCWIGHITSGSLQNGKAKCEKCRTIMKCKGSLTGQNLMKFGMLKCHICNTVLG